MIEHPESHAPTDVDHTFWSVLLAEFPTVAGIAYGQDPRATDLTCVAVFLDCTTDGELA